MHEYADPHEPAFLQDDREFGFAEPRRRTRTGKSLTKRQKFFPRLMARGDSLECFYCRQALSEDKASIDHRLPTSRGGKWRLENLVLACGPCNFVKGYLTDQEYLRLAELSGHRSLRNSSRLVLSRTGKIVQPLLGMPEHFDCITQVIEGAIADLGLQPSLDVRAPSASRQRRRRFPETIIIRKEEREMHLAHPTVTNFDVANPFPSGYPTGQFESAGLHA